MVQVGGRPLRLAEVGDEQAEVFVRVGCIRVGERLVRVAVVQGKAGSSLFGTEGVCVDQPLLGLFCGWLRQGDDVATAEDGRFDGAAVGGTQDKAAVLRRFFEGFSREFSA